MAHDQKTERMRLQLERRELKKAQKGPKPVKVNFSGCVKPGPIVIEEVIQQVLVLKSFLQPYKRGEFSKNTQLHEQADVILKMLHHNPMDSEPINPLHLRAPKEK